MTRSAGVVLVTGAGGFIGRHVVSALCARGDHVRALVRNREAAREIAAPGAEVIVGDLTNPAVVADIAAGAKVVFHLAGRLFAPGTRTEEYERLHVDATRRLFERCVSDGALTSFVLCSTTGVLGPTGAKPAREDDAGAPQNAYEITKAEAERQLRLLARQHGAPLVVVRPGLVYGPGDRHLAGWFRAIQGGYYRVVGPGTNHLHPIYIDDLVRGLLACETAASPDGRPFHIVGERPMTMRELSDAIGRAVGRAVPARHLPVPAAYAAGALFEAVPVPRRMLPLTRSRVRFLTQNRAYDGSRAGDELGFTPRIGIDDGLARTVAWYRTQGWL